MSSKQRYRVKVRAGVDLGGRIYPHDSTFNPKAEHEAWAERAVESGALERVDEAKPKAE